MPPKENSQPIDGKHGLTVETLREMLDYDPNSGGFTWKVNRGRQAKAGYRAGSMNNENGSLRIKIFGRLYCLHRLAWFYVHGKWPVGHIDHRDMDRLNNRMANLRECTRSQNMHNTGKKRNNGLPKGVSIHHRWKKRYEAAITVNGIRKSIGYFLTPEEAGEAYAKVSRELLGEFSRM